MNSAAVVMQRSAIEPKHAALLIHGLSGNPLEMQYLAKQMRLAGFATLVPHFKGYGFGERSDLFATGTYLEWVEQVSERFDQLAKSHRTVCVGGLCVGAVLALDLAARRPGKVAALSLLSTTLAYDGWSLPWYRFLAPLAYYTPLRNRYSYRERYPYGVKNEALRRWIAREMLEKSTSIAGASRLPMTAVHEARKLIQRVKKSLADVSAPALVIHARDDDVSSVKSAEFVVENIGSEHVRSLLLHDSYHMVTLDNEKALVADETIRFFEEHAKRAGAAATRLVDARPRRPAAVA